MKRFVSIATVLLLVACPPTPVPPPADAGVPDAGALRTLVTRPLMPTSPANLLRDPFVGGDAVSYGKFRAFFVGGPLLPLTRTFRSVSPVGGAVSIAEFRDLPPDAGGALSARVMSSFHGGDGDFSASIWLSAGDRTGAPVPFASKANAVQVSLLASDGSAKVDLVAGAPATFGDRQWVKFVTAGPVKLPAGGWLSVTLTDFSLSLQLAAPEVTSSAVALRELRALEPADDDDRLALRQAYAIDQNPPDRPQHAPADDR